MAEHQLALSFKSDAFIFLFHTGGICITYRRNDNYDLMEQSFWLEKCPHASVIREGRLSRRRDKGKRFDIKHWWRHWIMRDHYICMSDFVLTSRGTEGSNCRPRNDSSRLHISPLPKNMNPVTSQKTRGSWGETDTGIKGRMRIRSNSSFFFSFQLVPLFLFDCVSLTTKLNKTKIQRKILITENWHIWFWLHLLKGRL